MNCGWMLMTPGQDPHIDTTTSGGKDDAFVARKLAVDASKRAKSLKENVHSFVEEEVAKVEEIQESDLYANQDTYIADSFRAVHQAVEEHAALIETLQQ
ncbi:hypothetical protein CDV31_000810 [Fusarium ambrosium]|uniref:Uncharacterized protein n=1 Tax=Fusarium ambrosium TaxID=131363 RepID=A0A428V183_9HYPO|nr:hypothetical protein CDV31_000810 [Fusarium ambrosium]